MKREEAKRIYDEFMNEFKSDTVPFLSVHLNRGTNLRGHLIAAEEENIFIHNNDHGVNQISHNAIACVSIVKVSKGDNVGNK